MKNNKMVLGKKKREIWYHPIIPQSYNNENVMVLDKVIEEQFKATKNQELAPCTHGQSSMKAVFEGPGRGWPMGQHWSESKPLRES